MERESAPSEVRRQYPTAAKRIIQGLQLVRKTIVPQCQRSNRSDSINRRPADSVELGEMIGGFAIS